MTRIEKFLESIKDILFLLRAYSFGRKGRFRIDAGETYNTAEVFAVKAITADFTYGANCVAIHGEAPDEDDPLVQGDVDMWPASAVHCKTGSAWVYPV